MQNRPTLADIFPLPVEAKRLEVFLGNWNVAGTLTFMGKPFGIKGIAKFSSVAKGWGVLAHYYGHGSWAPTKKICMFFCEEARNRQKISENAQG